MKLIDLLNQRSAYESFDRDQHVPSADIHEMVRRATLAPSAFHMQNWRFIAVQRDESKQKLFAAGCHQQKVLDAPLVFIIIGDTDGYRHLAAALQPGLDNGNFPPALAQSWLKLVPDLHENNAQLRRDEAFRSASLAAMVLMLSAEEMGYATTAISGFDPALVQESFNLSESQLPVMLLAVGRPTVARFVQKTRLPVEAVLDIV